MVFKTGKAQASFSRTGKFGTNGFVFGQGRDVLKFQGNDWQIICRRGFGQILGLGGQTMDDKRKIRHLFNLNSDKFNLDKLWV